MTQKKDRLSRRNFLLTVGAGGVAGAAAVITGRQSAPVPVDGRGKRDTRGYQATAHVGNYYRTAKV